MPPQRSGSGSAEAICGAANATASVTAWFAAGMRSARSERHAPNIGCGLSLLSVIFRGSAPSHHSLLLLSDLPNIRADLDVVHLMRLADTHYEVGEDRLRALGFTVVRVSWADLRCPDRVVAEVRRAVARGRSAAWDPLSAPIVAERREVC